MEDMNHSQPPLTQEELHTLRIRISDLRFNEQELCFAISETFFDWRDAYRGNDVNGPLFEGDSPLSGKLKEGLRFREHYLVISEDLLQEIQKRYACSRVQVGRSPQHSERWTIYKRKVSYCVLQIQKMFNFGENERLTEKHVEVFAYNNTEDITAAIIKNQQIMQQFRGKLWIYPQKLPQRCLQLRTSLSDKTVIPISMLNNDPELYKLQRKFKKQFTFLVEMQGPNIVEEPKFKCYHHPQRLAKYICICMNERSFACDQKCIDSSSKHKRRCIYVPRNCLNQKYKEKEIDWPRPRQAGLYNEQNMCFFNTIVQCLAHIDRLSKYFLRCKEKDDLNYWNCDGTHGQVALQYGRFIREHWQGKYEKCNMPLFQVIGRWNPTYANKHQQDSHEFLIKMLDWLKEDLNLNECKPAYKYIETQNKNEEELAKETQQILRARNYSIVQQLMQGLQKSVIKCITCCASSSTFDSFMTVQLPMSSDRKVEICKNSCPAFLITEMNKSKIKKFQLFYDKDTTINDLKAIAKAIEMNDTEIDFYRSSKYGKVQILNNLNLYDLLNHEDKDQVIFCVEKYRKGQRSDTVEVKLVFQGSEPIPLSRPIYIPQEIEVQQLYVKILTYVFSCYTIDQLKSVQNYFAKTFQTTFFPFDLVIRKPNGQYIQVKRTRTYDKYTFQPKSSLLVKIGSNKDFYFGKLNTFTTINNVQDPKKKMMLIEPSIEDCLKIYCKKELMKDKWECPNCKTKRDAAKTLYFHRLPNILILSLNRFKEIYNLSSVNAQFQKNQSQIKFKNVLNMGEFTQSQVRQDYRLTAVACHIRLNDYLRDVQEMDGHYYAHIRTKQGWLRFDDTDVLTISEEKVLDDRSAYILFYEKM